MAKVTINFSGSFTVNFPAKAKVFVERDCKELQQSIAVSILNQTFDWESDEESHYSFPQNVKVSANQKKRKKKGK